jgi:hypothetical protein
MLILPKNSSSGSYALQEAIAMRKIYHGVLSRRRGIDHSGDDRIRCARSAGARDSTPPPPSSFRQSLSAIS